MLSRLQFFVCAAFLLGNALLPARTAGVEVSRMTYSNRLIHENSPYLLQHAHNPVDWYPWGEEAFEKARREDKPILLSIGYSTCHWCHVMEQESYSDPEVGKVLNDTVVAIKVDREERPDIDRIYMQAAQLLTGSGSWPLNVLMTPDKRPFYAATYLPKHSRFGRIGLIELVQRVHELWRTDRERLLAPASQLKTALVRLNRPQEKGPTPGLDTIAAGVRELSETFDAENGGFGAAPKFPAAQNLLFLLRSWQQTGDKKALHMVEKTLDAMRAGGIYDQVGFGFHRYATDARWLLPHFEKMLYDQAMLIMAYAEAYQATGKAVYARTTREIIAYVMRRMHDAGGGFYSAEDADSEGGEGAFYRWTQREFEHVLGREDAGFAASIYGLSTEGHTSDPESGEKNGKNVLYLRRVPSTPLEVARLEGIRRRLFAARERRAQPFRDDKILTNWNGLMIAALAIASRSLNEPQYAGIARRTAEFVLRHLRDKDGRLLHRYRRGDASLAANLDDYADLIWGLIELYETDFETRDLELALQLNTDMWKHFHAPTGGLYLTPDDGEKLLLRPLDAYDGALPSGNSVAMMNLIRLARMTGDSSLEQKAASIGQAFAREVARMPSAFASLLSASLFAEGKSYEVVLAGDLHSASGRAMMGALRSRYLPNKVVLWHGDGKAGEALSRLAPYSRGQKALKGRATAYVCENFRCRLPVTDPKKMLKLLGVDIPGTNL